MGRPSKLQKFTATTLYQEFPHLTIKENYWPEWLQNPDGGFLELDFYLPEIKIAIEVQGKQHYEYVPYFHGNYDGFLAQLKRDQIKRDTCAIEGIRLIEIDNEQDLVLFIQSIVCKDREKQLPRFVLPPPLRKDKPRKINKLQKRLVKKISRLVERADQLELSMKECEDNDRKKRMEFERTNIIKKIPSILEKINYCREFDQYT